MIEWDGLLDETGKIYVPSHRRCTTIDKLITYSFTFRSRIIHLYGDVTIIGEWMQNFGLCSALRAFE
jgi:hypothetical protein